MKKEINQVGLTVVEIMIVVGLISVLSAISFPWYINMKSKGLQTEAKVNLALGFSKLRSFQAEFGTFTSCLSETGFTADSVDGSGRRYYQIAIGTGTSCGPRGGQDCLGYRWNRSGTIQRSCNDMDRLISAGATYHSEACVPAGPIAFPAWISASQTEFVVSATGAVVPNTSLWEEWSIDNLKSLQYRGTRSAVGCVPQN